MRTGHGGNSGFMPFGRSEECGLCCEIMADDGHMMRTPELQNLRKNIRLSSLPLQT